MSMDWEIYGKTEPGFEKVKEVFSANWEGYEVGASFSVVCKGRKVVDLWGGFQDKTCTKPWEPHTLVNVYSTTKGMGSLAAAILADEGRLDYGALVTDYWPEFGAEGKHRVTVAQLLSHQAGVCGVSEKIRIEDLYDWDKMVRLLAAQKPFWEPGRGNRYHAVTWGFLAGELIRRITGKTLGQYFHEKVAGPLGADFYIGLPDSEMNRVADMIGANRARVPQKPAIGSVTALYPVALQNPEIRPFKDACSYAWRKAELAAANGQANARGIARIYGALANRGQIDGIRIISPKGIEAATREEVRGDRDDLILGKARRFARGFALNSEGMYGPNPRAFGHSGAGGTIGFADSDTNIAMGYAMNQMQVNEDDVPRAELLVKATYACLV
jgi:CubicO group peptidase (beta-lactamase class C family)